MRLSDESVSRRVAVMVPVWLVLGLLIVAHAFYVRDYLAIAGTLGLRGATEATTPLRAAFPSFGADAETWIRHALALLEGHDIRLRYTTIDNAPFGREVHWNSAWAWAIALAGKLDHLVTGAPITEAIERMVIWLPGLTLFGFMVGISGWATRRGGVMIGVLVAMAMVGHGRIYEGFYPSYVDHHGLITSAVFALILGACFMGGGWWRPKDGEGGAMLPRSAEEARSAAVFSGLGGAVGLWIGAASVIPPIAFVGLGGVIALLVCGRAAQARGDRFDGQIWRIWGRSGAVGSLFFYLLEYAPNHFGLRLEVNHPFYALAWLGAGELIASFSEWWLGGCRPEGIKWRRVAWAALAVVLAPATIAVGGTKVFVLIDPFLAHLHNDHIQEFLPLWRSMNRNGWPAFFDLALYDNIALVVAVVLLVNGARRLPIVLWFVTIITGLSVCLAWSQSRWLLNASGPQVCLVIALLTYFFAKVRPTWRWAAVLAVGGGLYGFATVARVINSRSDVLNRRVSPADANSVLFRDIARVIRASQPEGDVVLVSSPNSSTGIGYYGRFKTLGTLYWENNEGLKAAGRILAAQSLAEAEKLIKERKVTHIAILSEENFIAPYFQLLNPQAPAADVKKTFGYQLLAEKVVPVWLRTIPYRVPDDLKSLKVDILLMQVAFDQTPADALYNIALTKIEMGNLADAEHDLDELVKSAPASPYPRLRLADIMLARRDWSGATEQTLQGIQRMPANQQLNLYATAAANFYRQKRPVEAVRLYRAALDTAFDPNLAAYLSWVLATTTVDDLRNGPEALVWARKALEKDPNSSTYLNTAAAALAETGKFADAVETAERALANAKVVHDEQSLRITPQRLAAYQAGKAWRE